MRKTGTVKWFYLKTGMGIIEPDDGGDPDFVHIDNVRRAGWDELKQGQKVSYQLTPDLNGRTLSAGELQEAA